MAAAVAGGVGIARRTKRKTGLEIDAIAVSSGMIFLTVLSPSLCCSDLRDALIYVHR